MTYTPSPRRMGKKKVKLNPVKRPPLTKKGGRRSPSKLTQEANYGIGYDKTLPVVPTIGEDTFGANVTVIGGKSVFDELR